MPRKLRDHIVSGDQASQLQVEVLDEPGSGGANHLYHITGFSSKTNPSDPWTARHGQPAEHSTILFQNGPIPEVGVNGLTHEAVLAILIDRMRGFQKGPFACRENAIALTHLEESLMWLQKRTLARLARGVEGTLEV
jgi:hypothetical protein